jgi:hypothetical protein
MNPPDQSSTLPLSATQPPRETQAHLNQRSHQGAIPDQPVPEQYGPARIVTLLKSIDGCGHICSETAHELAHWLAACESARAKLAEENGEIKARCERIVHALHLIDDYLDDENVRLPSDCFVHCDECDPSFGECYRTSHGCRRQQALAGGKE